MVVEDRSNMGIYSFAFGTLLNSGVSDFQIVLIELRIITSHRSSCGLLLPTERRGLSVGRSVRLSVCQSDTLVGTAKTAEARDRDAVCVEDSAVGSRNHVLGSRSCHDKGNFECGNGQQIISYRYRGLKSEIIEDFSRKVAFWEKTPYGQIFKNIFRKASWRHRSTSCMQIS